MAAVLVQTLLRVQSSPDGTSLSEWIFLTNIDTPEAVASVLRPITLQLESRKSQQGVQAIQEQNRANGSSDKITRLKEASDLHAAGVLTDEEFAQLKREILG